MTTAAVSLSLFPKSRLSDMNPQANTCPSCGGSNLDIFYHVTNVPCQSARLFGSREAALAVPRGEIKLAYCSDCDFAFNQSFQPGLADYSAGYEGTQAFSGVFSEFHTSLAKRLIADYNLDGKTAVEIGCGNGEFLFLLNRLGDMNGIGYDPCYSDDSIISQAEGRIQINAQEFPMEPSDVDGDFYACKMTMEHIPDVADFVSTITGVAKSSEDAIVYFLVPNTLKILSDIAFWDVYYEHCSYFTPSSLQRLFKANGASVLRMSTDYDDQYLSIECDFSNANSGAAATQLDTDTASHIKYFRDKAALSHDYYRSLIDKLVDNGKTVALWGAGSKGVGFLSALEREQSIDFAIDINPNKRGTFLAGSGLEIIGPQDLTERKPDAVIIMNPIYKNEIQKQLQSYNLDPQVIVLDPFEERASA